MSPRRPDVPLPFIGKVDPKTGRALCVWCGTRVQGRRVRWCSDDCVLDYQLARGDQGAARRLVWKLHRGVCQICRVDVNKRKRELTKGTTLWTLRRERPDLYDQCRWEADHIVPIVEGGALARHNLRTVCRRCHKVVTKALRGRLAERRRAQA